MLNLIHRLIYTGQIDLCTPERETRHNMAPLIKTYVPLNDIVAKSPVFVARELWNAQPTDVRHIGEHELFKATIRKKMNDEYISSEIARLSAGIFV